MADRRERSGDHTAAMLAVLNGWQTNLWTALPGIIQSFNPQAKTCTVQPALKAGVLRPDGETEYIQLPVLLDCPVFFPSGGGVTLTFPLQAGDEALVVFASRCIDSWWQSGGVQVPAEFRMHNLSDGFVFAGISSKPVVPPAISASAAELRSHDAAVRISLDPHSERVQVVTPGEVEVTAGTIRLNGTLIINGTPYMEHQHRGVSAGASLTQGVA